MRYQMHIRTMLLLAIAAMASSMHAAQITAVTTTATISSTQLDPTDWQYKLTLTDRGNLDIGTFWFSWVPGKDFMVVAPSAVSSPASWTEMVTHAGAGDGYAIQWVAIPGDELTPGNSLGGFQFNSTVSPTDMAGDSPLFPGTPVLTAFTYQGLPFSDAGFQFLVQPAAASAAPEPVSGALALLGAGVLLLMRRRRIAAFHNFSAYRSSQGDLADRLKPVH